MQFLTLLTLCICGTVVSSLPIHSDDTISQRSGSTEAFTSRTYFMIGGEYVFDPILNGTVKVGQMYVEKLTPQLREGTKAKELPIAFIHGSGQTGSNWLNKPDGTVGWATRFLEQGYTVYLCDSPARGRSPYWVDSNVTETSFTAEFWEMYYTAPQNYNLFPQAFLHTQWNGPGTLGDPIFDAYFSATVQMVSVTAYQQTLMQKAGAALLDKIGPAIVLGHSSGGVMPWLWADARPDAVKAILAIEPSGPPFHDPVFSAFPSPVLGIADIPLTYSPPLPNTSTLSMAVVPSGGDPVFEIQNCTLQAEPARQLANLKNIPVLLTTAEASFHAFYDRCTVLFLQQAGVDVDWVPLQTVGIRGNGHFHFLEKNSDEIQLFLANWLGKTLG